MNLEDLGRLIGQAIVMVAMATVITAAAAGLVSFINWTPPVIEEMNGALLRLTFALSLVVSGVFIIKWDSEGEE